MRVGLWRSWVPKNWYFWTLVLKKTLESPMDYKEIQPVHPKGNKSWILFRRTEAEAPVLWPPDVKNWLIGKDIDVGKDWRQEENGMTEDEMVGWTWWTWVCINSRSWWWTGKPGMLQSMGPQRIRHDWTNELNWDKKKVGLALSDRLLMTLTSIYECIYMYKYHISPLVSWYTKINTDFLKLTLKLVIDYLNSCQMWYWFINNSHMVKNNPF